MSNIRNNKV